MRFLSFILIALFSASLHADPSTNSLDISVGTSVPKNSDSQKARLPSSVSRNHGGETFVISFNAPKTVRSVKITSYSTSRAGKLLIRKATASSGKESLGLEGLYDFNKAIGSGNIENYQNLVMLPDFTSVEVQPNQAFTDLSFTVEGFTNNDASMLIQIQSDDGFTLKEFIVSRSSNNESYGKYFNEKNYASFNASQLQLLMKMGTFPAAEDLAGKSFVCSSYKKQYAKKIDFKTRQYFLGNPPSLLQSISDLDTNPSTWILTEDGWKMSIPEEGVCGPRTNFNIMRMTPEGNLISEIVVDVNNLIWICANKGYTEDSTRQSIMHYYYPSVVSTKYAANYEFCRPRRN